MKSKASTIQTQPDSLVARPNPRKKLRGPKSKVITLKLIVSKRNYARQKKKCDKPMRKRNVQPSRKTATRFCVRNCVKPKRANDGWQRSRRVTPTFRNVAPGKRRAGHATSAWACNSRYKACI